MTGPRRRGDDHAHPEYWTEGDHQRFEDRVSRELRELRGDIKGIRSEVHSSATRLAWLLGALAVMVFVINIAVTIYIRLST